MIGETEVHAGLSAAVLVLALCIGTRGDAFAPGNFGYVPLSPRHHHSAPGKLARVLITTQDLDYRFKPARLTVAAGTEVVWINRTASPHTITSMSPDRFDDVVPAYRTAAVVFRNAGRFPYFCRYHPYMQGLIVVK